MFQDKLTLCPGCGLRSKASDGATDPAYNASPECLRLLHELTFYTLGRQDPFFVHQVLVDTYAAQHATPEAKPIKLAFALAGLWSMYERGFTGRQDQLLHIEMANKSKQWPRFTIPKNRGTVTIADVLAVEPGEARDEAIKTWGRDVWNAWKKEHKHVEEMLTQLALPTSHTSPDATL